MLYTFVLLSEVDSGPGAETPQGHVAAQGAGPAMLKATFVFSRHLPGSGTWPQSSDSSSGSVHLYLLEAEETSSWFSCHLVCHNRGFLVGTDPLAWLWGVWHGQRTTFF